MVSEDFLVSKSVALGEKVPEYHDHKENTTRRYTVMLS